VRRGPRGELPRDRFVYVDELECIGCTHCATTARNTFFMEEDHGRARVFKQDGDTEDLVAEAIDTCPVNCIWYVEWDDLVTLEKERANQQIDNFKRLVGATSQQQNNSRSGAMQSNIIRCSNCPQRGCRTCPMYGVGDNPVYKARVAERAEARRRRERESRRDRRAL